MESASRMLSILTETPRIDPLKNMNPRHYLIGAFMAAIMTACSSKEAKQEADLKEDLLAKEMLQGFWVDEDTELPVMRIEGDSFHYTSSSQPMAFKVMGDSLFLLGQRDTISYKILKKSERELWIQSIFGDEVRYSKTSYEEDLLAFDTESEKEIRNTAEQTQKDSVVIYQNKRYRGYVFVNPTQMKVIKSGYDDTGLLMDKTYFDNIIYLCVYQDKNQLWGSNIEKKLFNDLLSEDEVDGCILEDADFVGVDQNGYHFRLDLNVPDSYLGYHVSLTVSKDGETSSRLIEGEEDFEF